MKLTKVQLKKIITEVLGSPAQRHPPRPEEPQGSSSITPDDPVKDPNAPADWLKITKREKPDEKQYDGFTKNFYWVSSPPVEAVRAASAEADMWESGQLLSDKTKAREGRSYMLEGDKEAYPVLKKYFAACKPVNSGYFHQHPKGGAPGTPWSAAFVTWCMRHSDGPPNWDRSHNHQNPGSGGYLHFAWERRKDVEKNPKKYVGKTVYLAFSGKEIIGNNRSNKHSTVKPKDQYSAETSLISPGDVIGERGSDGSIHMDIFSGGGKKIGGNTFNSVGVKNTCGRRSADLQNTTDIIKRVTIKDVRKDASTDIDSTTAI